MMSELHRRPQLSVTQKLKYQNEYTLSIQNEYSTFVYDGDSVFTHRGQWRKTMGIGGQVPIDLEIGTGNGLHFAYRAQCFSERGLIGIEMRYKPLVQSIRRALNAGSSRARMVRIHAFNLDAIFEKEEINNIFIHFPDPWVSPRKPKNRVMNPRMLNIFWQIQKPGSFIEFKTDSREYFDWALLNIKKTPYQVNQLSYNFHQDFPQEKPIITAFERIFIQQGQPIHYALLQRN